MIAGGEASGDQAARERCLLTYKNCAAVRAAGKAPIRVGEPGYGTHLDSNKDGGSVTHPGLDRQQTSVRTMRVVPFRPYATGSRPGAGSRSRWCSPTVAAPWS